VKVAPKVKKEEKPKIVKEQPKKKEPETV